MSLPYFTVRHLNTQSWDQPQLTEPTYGFLRATQSSADVPAPGDPDPTVDRHTQTHGAGTVAKLLSFTLKSEFTNVGESKVPVAIAVRIWVTRFQDTKPGV